MENQRVKDIDEFILRYLSKAATPNIFARKEEVAVRSVVCWPAIDRLMVRYVFRALVSSLPTWRLKVKKHAFLLI